MRRRRLPGRGVEGGHEFRPAPEKFVAKVNIDVEPKDAEVTMNDDKVDTSKLGPYPALAARSASSRAKPGYARWW